MITTPPPPPLPSPGVPGEGVRLSTRISSICFVALAGILLLAAAARPWSDRGLSWDTRMLRAAALAHSRGLDPYHTPNLAAVTGREMVWPYVYPPATLWLIRPLAWVDEMTAVRVVIVVKLAAIVGLGLVWRKWIGEASFPAFALFALFAFQSPLWADLATGNISTFEQLLLWIGLTAWVARRDSIFASCVLGASVFKFALLPFLALLLVPREASLLLDQSRRFTQAKESRSSNRSSIAVFIVALEWYAVWIAFNAAAWPSGFRGYLANVRGLDAPWERGDINPSSFALLRDLTGTMHYAISPTLYALLVASVVGVSYRALRAIRSREIADVDQWTVVFACLAYALLMPRMKDYSYAILLVPAFLVATRLPINGVIALAALMCLPSTPKQAFAGFEPVSAVLQSYWPLAMAGVCWGVLAWTMLSPASRAAAFPARRVPPRPMPVARAA